MVASTALAIFAAQEGLAADIGNGVGNGIANFLISTAQQVSNTSSTAASSTDNSAVRGEVSYILFLVDGYQVTDYQRAKELFLGCAILLSILYHWHGNGDTLISAA